VKLRYGLATLSLLSSVNAAELKQETVKAWQEYVQSATSKMQKRLRPENHFLKVDEKQEWVTRVRSGEILVSPDDSKNMKKIPSGVIHDWFGAAFIPDAKLNDVVPVARDYDRYKEFYHPTVVDSKTLARGDGEDRFSIVVMNKSVLMKTAVDIDYKCSYARMDDRRWYSVSEATRIQEIENYGAPQQRELQQGVGHGLIWRLFSVTRYAERDGGVYVELEAIALSRDIPFSLGWIIDPIVRRTSRDSLIASLRQTQGAVRSGTAVADCNAPNGPCSPPVTGYARRSYSQFSDKKR
jgi:hypothetical protein